jgi:hypothetical protein
MRPIPLVLIIGLAVACGGDDDTVEAGDQATTTSSTTTTGADPVVGDISLTVQVSGVDPGREATITCGENEATGTGFLAEPSAAQAACVLLRTNPFAASVLVESPDPDRMCTQQYGGPEEATVTGTIGDRQVDATINRTDGCGIAEWELLTPLLGAPGG